LAIEIARLEAEIVLDTCRHSKRGMAHLARCGIWVRLSFTTLTTNNRTSHNRRRSICLLHPRLSCRCRVDGDGPRCCIIGAIEDRHCSHTKGGGRSWQSKDTEYAGNPWNCTVLVEVDMACYLPTSGTHSAHFHVMHLSTQCGTHHRLKDAGPCACAPSSIPCWHASSLR